MGEYDEKEEETGVDIRNREAKKNCFIYPALVEQDTACYIIDGKTESPDFSTSNQDAGSIRLWWW